MVKRHRKLRNGTQFVQGGDLAVVVATGQFLFYKRKTNVGWLLSRSFKIDHVGNKGLQNNFSYKRLPSVGIEPGTFCDPLWCLPDWANMTRNTETFKIIMQSCSIDFSLKVHGCTNKSEVKYPSINTCQDSSVRKTSLLLLSRNYHWLLAVLTVPICRFFSSCNRQNRSSLVCRLIAPVKGLRSLLPRFLGEQSYFVCCKIFNWNFLSPFYWNFPVLHSSTIFWRIACLVPEFTVSAIEYGESRAADIAQGGNSEVNRIFPSGRMDRYKL